jgi:anhydro-N-acetylmuramic acid kinase
MPSVAEIPRLCAFQRERIVKIIGLMSGTSADGIDAALCEISGAPPQLQARILAVHSEPYTRETRQRILDACQPDTSRVDEICRLSVDLAERFAGAILELLKTVDLSPADVDLIGSHGQTIWHDVLDGRVTSTLQIASASVIAERTGITTINNFRERDVAAGGQGAPLTGYADWLLLRHPTHWRAIQNIGGMANVTFLPPLSDTVSQPIAFDTGPGNALIDGAVSVITHGQQTYDRDGQIAAQGQVDETWLAALLDHPYFSRPIPKTTGRELFGSEMAVRLVREGQEHGLTHQDIVATITMLTAASIANAYQTFAPQPVQEVILGGGGRHNHTLVQMLTRLVDPTPVLTHEAIGLDSDFKEALVFALLAYETWHGRVGCLSSQTGAAHPTVLGQITPGQNYARLIRQTWCEPV